MVRRLAAAGLSLILALGLASCAKKESVPTQVKNPMACSYLHSGEPARPVDPPSEDDVSREGVASFTMKMSGGDVVMKLDRSKAPCAVHSFENLVAQGFFDNTKCHRLVERGIFVLQCGDPTGTGTGGPGYSFADELDSLPDKSGTVIYPRGTVAMANAGPDTNGSQFFIVWNDSPLAPAYTIMGTVEEESMQVIDNIASQGIAAEDGITPIADASIIAITAG